MSLHRNTYLFKTLDNPSRLLFWEIDDFLCFVVPIFLGLSFDSLYLILTALPLKLMYSRLKKKFPYGQYKHQLYWHLPTHTIKYLKHLPPSHQREYLL